MSNEGRPDPDKLLSQIQAEEKKTKRGRLKIFFGSCAGVGKTYAMLSAARTMHQQGVDVVVGLVETHGRPQTEALLQGLPVLPPQRLPYGGTVLNELDLEAVLERKPHTVLIDELAHTNAPGALHPKRWNDVIEILDAGINVMTTLNVQHIESLSDVVASATGVWVKETVPDTIFDLAEDIMLVDIDPDDLLIRLREGNIYIAPDVSDRAAQNFFKIDNLNSLREIALRRMAERVDAERAASILETGGKTLVTDRLLLVIDASYESLKLVRSVKRLAGTLKAPWTVLYIESGEHHTAINRARRRIIETIERVVNRLDGKMETTHSNNRLDEILSYANKNNISKIIVGKPPSSPLRGFFRRREIQSLIENSGNIDVLTISHETETHGAAPRASFLSDLKPLNYLLALLAMLALTLPGLQLPGVLTTTDQALLYLMGCILVAERFGFGPALFYCLVASLYFNIFFFQLQIVQTVDSRSSIMTLLVMLATGYVIATQASSLRSQAHAARDKEGRTRALYEITRKLTGTRGREPVARIVADFLSKTHAAEVAIWMTDDDGHPAIIYGTLPSETYYKDFGALQWCFENNKNAGRGTTTMPAARGFYLPLIAGEETLGVLGLYPNDPERLFSSDDVVSIETLSGLLASALLRVRAGEVAAETVARAQNDKLRDSLLTTFAQGLLLPLENISRMIGALLSNKDPSPESIHALASSLNRRTKELSRTIDLLLDTAKLEHGALQARMTPCALGQIIDNAIKRLSVLLASNGVVVDIDPALPDCLVDPLLMEQLVVSLLENAAQFSPPDSVITIEARPHESVIKLTIEDEGPGLPKGFEEKIFDKFCSIMPEGNPKRTGLGLSIAASIARLHRATLQAENRAEGGARFSVLLPLTHT